MTGYTEHDHEDRTPPSFKRRMMFVGVLLLSSTLIYAELVLRFSQ
ncbi:MULTISPECIES: hypothetical protein [Roseovarius]|uniref:Uncharacterized protein n=2 Tax=Roseovarius TaxID=74030 RepID=A0ABZ2HII9_9RHOB|nr:hypothetical protein [Roseovarius sp. W115]MDV2929124.1 hypothetical protein [Roseovarius sp. W115]